MTSTPILAFLENVASSPKGVIQAYTKWAGGSPVLVSAQTWGWVHRNRLFWVSGPRGDLHQLNQPDLPDGFSLEQDKCSRVQVFRLVAKGNKPFPAHVPFALGYTHTFDQHQVAQGHSNICFHTFTREFWHPTDRVKMASPAAADRFHRDSRR